MQVNKIHKTSFDNNYEYPYTKSVNILKYPDKFAKGNPKSVSSIPDYYFDDDPPYIGFKANRYNNINWLEGFGKTRTSSTFQSSETLKLPSITDRENTVDSIKSTSKLEKTMFFLPEITRHSPLKEGRLVRDVATAMSDNTDKEQKYKKTTINLNEEIKPEDENVVYYLIDDDDLDFDYAPLSYPPSYPSYPPYPYYPPQHYNYGPPPPAPPPSRFNPFNQPPGPGFESYPSNSFNGFPQTPTNGFNNFTNQSYPNFNNNNFNNFNNDNPNNIGVVVKYSHFPSHNKDKS
jgi:hypothetical protein